MANKVIGFTLRVTNVGKSKKELESIEAPFKKILKSLTDIGKKTKDVDKLLTKLKKLRTELDRVSKRNVGSGGTTSSSSSGSGKALKEQQKLNTEIQETQRTLAQVRKELQLVGDKGSQEYKDLVTEAGKLKRRQQEANKEIARSARLFEENESSVGSYKQLNAELVRLRDRFRNLSAAERDGIAGKETLQRIRQLDGQLKGIDQDIGQYFRNVGNYKSAFDGLGRIVTRFVSILGLTNGLSDIINTNAEISDSIADVAKTTDSTIESIRNLSESLKFRDTRTSLADLLGIAEIGGRLGVAESQLQSFTEAIDTAFVALGDQFQDAGAVTDTLGKIRNVLADTNTGEENLSEDLLRIGNALNVLETQGPATAKSIADFVNRLAGVSGSLDISADKIFGLATTLNELGENPERASTAVQKLLLEIAKTPDTFAQLVGKGSEEFRKVVENDIVEALALVTQATVQGSESNVEFAAVLDSLGIRGQKAIGVFGKLGSNYDKLKERIDTANTSLQGTDSLFAEFEKKNATFGASIEKLQKSFVNLTTNSGLQDFLQVGVDRLATFINQMANLPKFLSDNRAALILLGTALVALKIDAAASQVGALIKAYRAWSATTTIAASIQAGFNRVLTANPIGLIVVAVGLVVAALVKLSKENKKVGDAFRLVFEEIQTYFTIISDAFEPLVSVLQELFQENEAFGEALSGIGDFLVNVLVGAIQGVAFWIRTLGEGVQFLSDNALLAKTIVVEAFTRIGLQAEKLWQQIQRAFTFRAGALSEIDNEIKAIEDKLKQSEERIAKVREERDKKIAERQAKREADRAKRVEQTQREAQNRSNKIATDGQKTFNKLLKEKEDLTKASNKRLLALAEGEDKELAKLAKKEIRRRKQVADAAEKAAKDRLKAAEQIAKLEASLLNNQFDREIASAEAGASSQISGIVGDATQIEKQTELIKQALQKQITEINKNRKEAQDAALQDITNFQNELALATSTGSVTGAEQGISALDNAFKLDTEKLKTNLSEAKALLQAQLSEGVITKEQFDEQTTQLDFAFNESKLERERQFQIDKLSLQTEFDAARVELLNLQFQQEVAQIDLEAEQKLTKLQEQLDAELITRQQFEEAKKAIEDNAKIAKQEADLQNQSAQAELVQTTALNNLQAQQLLADSEVKINKEKNDKIIADEKRRQAEIAKINQLQLDLLGTFVSGAKNLLGQDEKIRKEHVALLKGLALAEIAINLQKELSSIAAAAAANPTNAVTFGGAGVSQYAIQSAIAIARAAFAAAGVFTQKLEYGGTVSTSDSSVGNTVSNVSNQTFSSIGAGASVPNEGVTVGQPHSMNGIPVTDRHGNFMELENGEYALRNGSETYIINRKSTTKFKPLLNKLKGTAKGRFSASKKIIASNINSFHGWGRKLNFGGVIPSSSSAGSVPNLSINPLRAPNVSNIVSGIGNPLLQMQQMQQQNRLMIEYINEVANHSAEVNERLDRLVVVADPEEIVAIGSDQIVQTQNGEL